MKLKNCIKNKAVLIFLLNNFTARFGKYNNERMLILLPEQLNIFLAYHNKNAISLIFKK